MTSSLYESDFYAWANEQATLLRTGNLSAADIEHIAEEIESMGKSDLRAMESSLARVIEHLLKLAHSPAEAPRAGWRESVAVHRVEFAALAEDNPGLVSRVRLPVAYERGRQIAIASLTHHDGVNGNALPATCPWSFNEIMDEGFWPGGAGPGH
ncbi:MAG: DUF29 domain-containing protein [Alphaproteobacteria bacterium]|nr:DUF29 domain-containing protein [Alphaproteobacteria bacterium]